MFNTELSESSSKVHIKHTSLVTDFFLVKTTCSLLTTTRHVHSSNPTGSDAGDDNIGVENAVSR